MSYIRILSIDGGGIRGIIPAQILVYLEKLLQKQTGMPDTRISDYFDLIAGTSTGGILSCLYLCPDKARPAKAKFTAEDAINLYINNGKIIFENSFLGKISSLRGLCKSLYSARPLESLLEKYFEDTKLSELLKPCLITSYDINNHKAVFFNKISALKNSRNDFFVKDVARATSSAPSYFPTAQAKSLSNHEYSFIDGGVFANNPTLCAYTEASKINNNPDLKNVLILSLGTGLYETEDTYTIANNWGKIKWLIPIFNIMMSGSSQTVDHQLNMLFKSIGKSGNYLRINPSLKDFNKNIYELDNTSSDNINSLIKIGTQTANIYSKKLNNFSMFLTL